MPDDFPRMMDKGHKPTEEEIAGYIGEETKQAWQEMKRFIEDQYDVTPEKMFYGKKYGWTIRYRKGNKTLCSLFPEKGGFTVLIILGRKESEKALSMQAQLSPKIQQLLIDTKQLHDGRWLWIRLKTVKDVKDVKELLEIKRKPYKRKVKP